MSANTPLNNIYADPNVAAINILSGGPASLKNATDAIHHFVAKITNANINATQKGAIYFPPRTYTISTDCTIPAGVRVVMEHGATFSIDSGKTLTIAGQFEAPLSQVFSGSGTAALTGPLERMVPQWWGATGNGSTDDTTAINAAITAASRASNATRGMILYFPPGDYYTTTQLTAPGRYVHLLGAVRARGAADGLPASRLRTTLSSSAMFDLGNNTTGNVTFENLFFYGLTAGTKDAHCIYTASCTGLVISGCSIQNFGGSGVYVDGGLGFWMNDCLIDGCNRDYANFSDYQGALYLSLTEPHLYNVEVSGGVTQGATGAGGSGYACAIISDSSPGNYVDVVAQFGQTGWYITSNAGGNVNKFVNCRSEGNQREGWLVAGGKNYWVNCTSNDNSQHADDSYDGWSFTQTGRQNRLVSCTVGGTSGASLQQRYGFSDAAGAAANNVAQSNHYTDCGAPFNIRGRSFNITGTILPIIAPYMKNQALTGSTATTTFSGEDGDIWVMTAASGQATEITAQYLLPGHLYHLYIIQHATAPAITLGAVFTKVQPFVSPAASKHLSATFRSDGTSLYQVGAWSGDT
jgi:hypothetical protein